MLLHRRAASTFLKFVVLVIVAGCGKTSPPASGIVQFEDGEKVQSGSIEFRSSDGAHYSSRIAKNGTYTLRNKDGDAELPIGDFDVVVVQIVLTEDLPIELHQHGRTVPRRYADYYTSKLKYTNNPGRTERIKIELSIDE